MAYNSVSILANHMLALQRRLAERANQFRAGILPRAAGDSVQHTDDGNTQMTETRLFVGLNDADTKQQKYGTERYKSLLKKVCQNYRVPFSEAIEEGGYYHDDGEYTEEQTLVLTLIDAEKDTIQRIAEDLCCFFRQESVLITEDVIKGRFFAADQGERRITR